VVPETVSLAPLSIFRNDTGSCAENSQALNGIWTKVCWDADHNLPQRFATGIFAWSSAKRSTLGWLWAFLRGSI